MEEMFNFTLKHLHSTFYLFKAHSCRTLMRAAPTSDDDVVFDDFEIALEVNDKKIVQYIWSIFGKHYRN